MQLEEVRVNRVAIACEFTKEITNINQSIAGKINLFKSKKKKKSLFKWAVNKKKDSLAAICSKQLIIGGFGELEIGVVGWLQASKLLNPKDFNSNFGFSLDFRFKSITLTKVLGLEKILFLFPCLRTQIKLYPQKGFVCFVGMRLLSCELKLKSTSFCCGISWLIKMFDSSSMYSAFSSEEHQAAIVKQKYQHTYRTFLVFNFHILR